MDDLLKKLLADRGMSEDDFNKKVDDLKAAQATQQNLNNLGQTLVSIMKKQKDIEDRLTAGGL